MGSNKTQFDIFKDAELNERLRHYFHSLYLDEDYLKERIDPRINPERINLLAQTVDSLLKLRFPSDYLACSLTLSEDENTWGLKDFKGAKEFPVVFDDQTVAFYFKENSNENPFKR